MTGFGGRWWLTRTKPQNPVAQIKRNGTISIVTVMVLYILANVAYVAAGGLFCVLFGVPNFA